ncbi:MAG: sugar ABC transporter ATP-binding protein [Planctomycetaceae bacterium]
MAESTLLCMRDVGKRFGATIALHGVSFEVRAGEVMALIGENGAGKSTLMKVLSGAHRPDSGRMQLAGRPYRPANPHDARIAGVAMIYQELNLAPDLSVEDNVMLGQESRQWGFLQRAAQRPRVQRALERLGRPDVRPETPVGELSLGAQQLVEIARALVSNAKVVVFDEPTSSLSGPDAQRLFAVIRRLRESGIGIVYISHFLEEVREICDRFTVLRDGVSVGEGVVADVSDDEIVSLMVGRTVDELFPTVPHSPGETLVSIDGLSGTAIPRNITLNVRRGEVLGIAGLVGAGRTEFLRCLFGLDAATSGTVRVAGASAGTSPRQRIAAGFGLVSEDRKGEGLSQIQSITDNVTESRLGPYSQFGFLDLATRESTVRDWMDQLHVKARSPSQCVAELSGGNQQKVALARVLHQQANILLLDEPTRGIDVATKSEIYRLMGEAAAAENAVVFVSSYFSELLAVCDRIAVFARGELRDVRPTAQWTEESILSAAIGTEKSMVDG